MVHPQQTLVDQVVVALTTNQEQLELQTKDMLVRTPLVMLTQEVVVLELLLLQLLDRPDQQLRQLQVVSVFKI
jgi:hypothetical protein